MNDFPKLEQLQTLNVIGQILNREPDVHRALSLTLEKLITLLGLETGWVFLSTTAQGQSREGDFTLAAYAHLPPALAANKRARLCQDSCECQGMFRRGELDRGVSRVTCSRLKYATGDTRGLRVHASIPLLTRDTPVGIINLAAAHDSFEDQLDFLTVVGRYLGTALERAQFQAAQLREATYAAGLEERERIAQDVHDSVTQLLFAADLSLSALPTLADKDAQQAQTDRAQQSVRQALEALRAIVEVRRPADLSLGLEAALKRLAARLPGLNVHTRLEPLSLSAPCEDALYRIFQEATHNVLRHAGASNLWLELKKAERGIVLSVRDDGKGVTTLTKGLGLNSIEARVADLGGVLNFGAAPGGGFVLRAEVPCPAAS